MHEFSARCLATNILSKTVCSKHDFVNKEEICSMHFVDFLSSRLFQPFAVYQRQGCNHTNISMVCTRVICGIECEVNIFGLYYTIIVYSLQS